ncbi:MAG: sodium-dependent bicarbonate transport family permease [Bacteroidetes bacterium]|nr:sodium-dependent bicarbonate transport family permease [Bacteroidota bacterium]
MDLDLILHNLFSPPILFFLGGLLAVAVRSDLEIPRDVAKFLSLFLLFSIGLKGGMELGHGGDFAVMIKPLIFAVLLAVLVPLYTFVILKRKLDVYNAGAVAATYGSVSAVTFVTAVSFLEGADIAYGGHMIAALAIMESPAIIVGVILIGRFSGAVQKGNRMRKVLHEAFTNGSVFIILLSLVIGLVIADDQYEAVAPFSENLFKGILTLFMLDMGLLAGKRISGLRTKGGFLVLFGILVPFFNAGVTMLLCPLFGISLGNAFLLTILAASASYIAVPAAMRMAVPKANPGIYVPLSLGITFPINIIVGIPVYYMILQYLYA